MAPSTLLSKSNAKTGDKSATLADVMQPLKQLRSANPRHKLFRGQSQGGIWMHNRLSILSAPRRVLSDAAGLEEAL
jgi:hypothetical protein